MTISGRELSLDMAEELKDKFRAFMADPDQDTLVLGAIGTDVQFAFAVLEVEVSQAKPVSSAPVEPSPPVGIES